VVVPTWDEHRDICVDLLKSIVGQCLAKADKMDYKTIAFPPLGLGYWDFPLKVVADVMIETVHKYLKSAKCPRIKTVYLCSIDKRNYKDLVNQASALISDGRLK